MKKIFVAWFVAIFAIGILSCSLAPDSRQILGDWWQASQVMIMSSASGAMTNQTNYANAAQSETHLTIGETQIFITTYSNGGVIERDTNNYTLNEDAGTIDTTMNDVAVTLNYTLENDVLSLDTTMVTNYGTGDVTNDMDMVFNRME